jgi:hypothetical protein
MKNNYETLMSEMLKLLREAQKDEKISLEYFKERWEDILTEFKIELFTAYLVWQMHDLIVDANKIGRTYYLQSLKEIERAYRLYQKRERERERR